MRVHAFARGLRDGEPRARAPEPGRNVGGLAGRGERAMTGASLLAARGYDVDVLDGGPDIWSTATGQPLQTGQ